jgi:hypothetical protein
MRVKRVSRREAVGAIIGVPCKYGKLDPYLLNAKSAAKDPLLRKIGENAGNPNLR